jgi:hypothetical protein
MNEHNSSTAKMTPPPTQVPLVLVKSKEAYRAWHINFSNLKRIDRQTLGGQIDNIFLSLLELIFRATFAYDKFEKLSIVSHALGKNDILKFFLQLGWEQKVIDHKTYSELILLLDEEEPS